MSEQAAHKLQNAFAEADEAAIDKALRDLLREYEGRKFLWWLLQIGKVGLQPFNGNALGTAFGCGELNVGQQILDRIIQVDPAGYVAMMQEQADERRTRDTSLGNAASDSDAGGDSGGGG